MDSEFENNHACTVEMNEDDDEDYVPESLRGFLEAADKKLQNDLDDVLNFDFSKPKPVPKPCVVLTDDDATEDREIFYNILAHETDESLKHDLLKGLEEDLASPPLEPPPSTNPANNLTEKTAKRIAMEGVTPRGSAVTNLQEELDHAWLAGSATSELPNTKKTTSPKGKNRRRVAPAPSESTSTAQQSSLRAHSYSSTSTTTKTNDGGRNKTSSASAIPPGLARYSYAEGNSILEIGHISSVLSSSYADSMLIRTVPSESAGSKQKSPKLSPTAAKVAAKNSPSPSKNRNSPQSLQITPISKAQSEYSHSLATPGSNPVAPGQSPKVVGTPRNGSGRSQAQQRKASETAQRSVTESQAKSTSPTKRDGNQHAQKRNAGAKLKPMPESTPSPPKNPTRNAIGNKGLNDDPSGARKRTSAEFHPNKGRQKIPQSETEASPKVVSIESKRSPPWRPQEIVIPNRPVVAREANSSLTAKSSTSFEVNTHAPSSATCSPAGSGMEYVSKTMPTTSPLHPRLLQGTSASIGKSGSQRHEKGPMVKEPKTSGQRELTVPVNLSSRLLQGTSASTAKFSRNSNSSSTFSSTSAGHSCVGTTRLLKPARELYETKIPKISKISPTEQATIEKEATKERVRARIEAQKRKDAERKKEIEERILMRQWEQREKKEKMQMVLHRSRAQRQRLESMERERVAKLQEKISTKEQRSRHRQGKENLPQVKPGKNVVPISALNRLRKVTPTVPIGPNLRTEQRLKNRSHKVSEGPISIARSDDILKRELRAERTPTPESQRRAERKLTVPQGPNLATSKRHGLKLGTSPTRKAEAVSGHYSSWESELRSTSSPSTSIRSPSSRLTIPNPPKFHEIHHRPPPKSTAEREKEEMEYYLSHPFKARPVRMNSASPPKLRNPPAPRRLTTPSPFTFLTDQRAGKHKDVSKDDDEDSHMFKALPMPNFSVSKTPLTGPSPMSRRKLTTPEPFRLRTEERVQVHGKPKSCPPTGSLPSRFHARRVPDFSRPTGLIIHRRCTSSTQTRSSRRSEPLYLENTYQFRARPVPNFLKSGPPMSITMKVSSSGDSNVSPRKAETKDLSEDEITPFHARKSPSMSQPSIPVKLRLSDRVKHPTQARLSDISTDFTFHARPVPKSIASPTIPVRDRDPSKLRTSPVRANLNLSPPPTSVEFEPFHARKAPKKSPPSIPVRERHQSKLKSPVTRKSNDPPSGDPKAKPVPDHPKGRDPSPTRDCSPTGEDRAPLATSRDPQGESPTNSSLKNLSAKARIRERMMGKTESTTSQQDNLAQGDNHEGWFACSPLPINMPTLQTNSKGSAPQGKVFKDPDPYSEQYVSPYATTPLTKTCGGGFFNNPPVDASGEETRRIAYEEALENQRMGDTIRMAQELQRAAEDELSFHGSINSRDIINTTSSEDFM